MLTVILGLSFVALMPEHVCEYPFQSMRDARGIVLVAQRPGDGVLLMPKDEGHPKLWYAPVASRAERDGVAIWYQRVDSGEAEYVNQRTLCLGELSADGWKLPSLHDGPAPWGGPNNICMTRSPHKPTWGGFNVFQMVEDHGTLRMLYWDQPASGEAGGMLAESRDGRVWTKLDTERAVFTEHNDAFSLMRVGEEYLLYQTALDDWPDKPYPDNLDKKRRVVSLRTSNDLHTWTPQAVFLHPDQDDKPETEFYLMKAFRYGSGFLGLVMKYYADPKMPNKHSAIMAYELIVSDDAKTWRRPFRNTDVGFWSYADPFLYQGKLHFVIWENGAMRTVAYAPNRLVAAHADEPGVFTMGPFSIPPSSLAIDADASKGSIAIEMLNAKGKPLTGIPIARIDGQNGQDLATGWEFRDAPHSYSLRFTLDHADVFAVGVKAGR